MPDPLLSLAAECAFDNCPSESSQQEARLNPLGLASPFEVRHLLSCSYRFAESLFRGYPLETVRCCHRFPSPL
jgi:hypothetical protein